MKVMALAAVLIAMAGAALSQVDIAFGPNPRSYDNLEVWDYSSKTSRQQWTALNTAGVTEIHLNAAFLLRHDILQMTPPRWPARPAATYLTGPQFSQMKDLVRRGGFRFVYEAGYGLGGDRCRQIKQDPVTGGAAAALVEYNNVLRPMLDNQVPVHAIAVDGAFLRLIAGSKKAFSCDTHAGVRLKTSQTVAAVQAYLVKMVALLATHPVQRGIDLQVDLTINLPNWKVGDLDRVFHPEVANPDLLAVLAAFDRLRDSAGQKPAIRRIKLDYPYCYVTGPCAAGGRPRQKLETIFVSKVAEVWDHSRGLNGPGSKGPTLSVVTNTEQDADSCVVTDTKFPFFLVYRACRPAKSDPAKSDPAKSDPGTPDCAPGQAWEQPMPWCQIETIRSGDHAFYIKSFKFADRLKPSGDLRKRISAQSSLGQVTIDQLIFQAWHETPYTNAAYRRKVTDYAK
ncbi:hypothetical protein K3727_21460 (plasmid) [Rhodobacteraceae bacterium M382]|nr:hypothetical protein K3727_21460 [Rhodobacteraceae bacterium M382]